MHGKIKLIIFSVRVSRSFENPTTPSISSLFASPQSLSSLMNLTLRLFLPSLLLAATCLGAVEKPNLVVFISDDLGRLDTSIHGSKDVRTPTMDLLAAGGMTFDKVHSASSISVYSIENNAAKKPIVIMISVS